MSTPCPLACTDECLAEIHGVPSECPSTPTQRALYAARMASITDPAALPLRTQYTFVFKARRVGALGIHSTHRHSVVADTLPAARLALYETFEHIYDCVLVETTAVPS
jgi:hypothetical protein